MIEQSIGSAGSGGRRSGTQAATHARATWAAPGAKRATGATGARAWLPVQAGLGIGVNTMRLRARLRALQVIGSSDTPVHDAHVFLTADGVRLTDAQQRAASAYARREGLAVLDLVPEELSPHQLLDLARMVDPHGSRKGRLTRGRGAYLALLVDREVLDRAGLAPEVLNCAELVTATETPKRYAPTASRETLADRRRDRGRHAGCCRRRRGQPALPDHWSTVEHLPDPRPQGVTGTDHQIRRRPGSAADDRNPTEPGCAMDHRIRDNGS